MLFIITELSDGHDFELRPIYCILSSKTVIHIHNNWSFSLHRLQVKMHQSLEWMIDFSKKKLKYMKIMQTNDL